MVLRILNALNPADMKVLETPCANVVVFDEDIRQLCANMVETMFASNGVGLAAPQVGWNLNIFVMRTIRGIENNTNEHIVLINPYTAIEIGGPVVDEEGCLSFPGIFGKVERFEEVGGIYFDVDGKLCPAHFTGFQARIYQHEFDHLVGTLLYKRAQRLYTYVKNGSPNKS